MYEKFSVEFNNCHELPASIDFQRPIPLPELSRYVTIAVFASPVPT